MNPPYGREIRHWIKKAHDEAAAGRALVVALIPARTDTSYWHDYIWDEKNDRPREGVGLRFIRGRVKFENEQGAMGPAPFPSAIVIFGRKP